MNGGHNGHSGENLLIRNNRKKTLRSREELEVQKGDQILIKTPGGGGYGAP